MDITKRAAIAALAMLTNKDRTNPDTKNRTVRIMADFFCTAPDGRGRFGLSILSVLKSNKSLETSPPKYNRIEDMTSITRSKKIVP